jgi:hypothetical protein
MMVCCYLVNFLHFQYLIKKQIHSNVKPTALEAMEYFAGKRTHDGEGVTIPSQRRYVCYYELVKKHGYPQFPTIKLESIQVSTTKYVKGKDAGKVSHFERNFLENSAPYCKIVQGGKELFTSTPVRAEKDVDSVIDCKDLEVTGDFKVYLFDKYVTKVNLFLELYIEYF